MLQVASFHVVQALQRAEQTAQLAAAELQQERATAVEQQHEARAAVAAANSKVEELVAVVAEVSAP